jgi:hypothetical protein
MAKETSVEINKAVRDFVADSSKWEVGEKTKVLEIRTGDAQEIVYPIKVSVGGVTTAPFEFYNKRIGKAELHDKNKVHLLVDKEGGKLTLVVDENYEKGTVVIGSIQENKYLKAFYLNTDKTFSARDLAKILKVNKTWFTDPNQCGEMVHNMTHFEGQWEVKSQNVDNQKGNTLQKLERTLKSEVPLGFSLTIPPFKGFENKTFKVEICVAYSGTDISFYLESIDLMQLQLELRAKEIGDRVADFNDEICIFEV